MFNTRTRDGSIKDRTCQAILLAGLLLLPHITANATAAPPAEGLLAHWSFDNLENGALDAKTAGKPKSAEGVTGRSLQLDGRHDYVIIEDAESLDFSTATFSVVAWVNVYALRGDQQMIVAKNVYSANQREWGLMVDADQHFRFYLQSGGKWNTVESQTVPELGHWCHVAVTVDTGKASLYVNGKREGNANLGPSVPNTTAPLTIGAVNDGGRVWQTFFGALDEVQLYNRALSAHEVAGMYHPVDTTHALPEDTRFILWKPDQPFPKTNDIPFAEGTEFAVIKAREPEVDGYNWLHGVALCWHKNKLYATFGHNKGHENTSTELARGCVSSDGGRTWGPVFTIDDGDTANPAVSHGVLLSHAGQLWAFHGAFNDRMQQVHTLAFVLDETSGNPPRMGTGSEHAEPKPEEDVSPRGACPLSQGATWQPRGIVAQQGFWPLQEPLKMDDGNWIMAGIAVDGGYGGPNDPAAVAISHGDDLAKWDVVVIPKPQKLDMWGESTVIVDGAEILNIARWRLPIALAATSKDYGRTWTESCESNLPMAASKPYAGTLSTGQHYLVATTTADCGNRRSPLTIAVTRPGEKVFSKIYRIRDAVHDGPGESDPKCRLSYPYAVEHNGKLYVGYSNDGSRGANRNSAELAIVPVTSLGAE